MGGRGAIAVAAVKDAPFRLSWYSGKFAGLVLAMFENGAGALNAALADVLAGFLRPFCPQPLGNAVAVPEHKRNPFLGFRRKLGLGQREPFGFAGRDSIELGKERCGHVVRVAPDRPARLAGFKTS
jgi:hypothetical protein